MQKNLSIGFKKKCLYGVMLFILIGCSNDALERNPFLPAMRFSIPINLSLPQYDNLRFAGGAILLPNYLMLLNYFSKAKAFDYLN